MLRDDIVSCAALTVRAILRPVSGHGRAGRACERVDEGARPVKEGGAAAPTKEGGGARCYHDPGHGTRAAGRVHKTKRRIIMIAIQCHDNNIMFLRHGKARHGVAWHDTIIAFVC